MPNASLQLAQHGGSSNLYQATGAASYNSPAAYMPSAGVHSVNASPDSSTAPYGERCGKENTSLSNGGAGLTTGDRNGKTKKKIPTKFILENPFSLLGSFKVWVII